MAATNEQSIAIWLEGVALVAIFVLELKEYRRQGRERVGQHRESAAQMAIMQSQADATRANAEAAKDNAEALKNSERAWILVRTLRTGPYRRDGRWVWNDGRPLTMADTLRNEHLKPELIGYAIKNYGRTPGWVRLIGAMRGSWKR